MPLAKLAAGPDRPALLPMVRRLPSPLGWRRDPRLAFRRLRAGAEAPVHAASAVAHGGCLTRTAGTGFRPASLAVSMRRVSSQRHPRMIAHDARAGTPDK